MVNSAHIQSGALNVKSFPLAQYRDLAEKRGSHSHVSPGLLSCCVCSPREEANVGAAMIALGDRIYLCLTHVPTPHPWVPLTAWICGLR